MNLWIKIVLCILVINGLGAAGAIFTADSLKDWYENLNKPPGVPPNSVFGPVWTILYAMMGTSLALIWHRVEAGKGKTAALAWFFVQFVFNLSWTPVFFGARQLGWALLVIVLLFGGIVFTIVATRKVDRLAAMLLLPYLGWVGYATYLNAGYYVLNR
ncbi:MAG: TspO/MBR family protein [Verrucomicrobiota bacterium]